MNKKFHK